MDIKDCEYWHLCIGVEPVDDEESIEVDDLSLLDLVDLDKEDEDYAGRILIDIIKSATRNLPKKERDDKYIPNGDDDEYMNQLRENAAYVN